MYAYGNPNTIKLRENSDGVVPLSSQLLQSVQQESIQQTGFDASHVGILTHHAAVAAVVEVVSQVKTRFPEEHMHYYLQGGFDEVLDERYSNYQVHIIRHYGKILRALTLKKIEPINDYQQQFMTLIQGQRDARDDVDKAWLKFIVDYPDWAERDAAN